MYLQVYNHIESDASGDNWLILFKLYPSVITPDNLHTNIFISSLLDSPLDTLYHILQKVFAPVLIKEGKWSHSVDPKIQDLVTQLEAGLGSVLRRQGRDIVSGGKEQEKDIQTLGILTVLDEYQFWVETADASMKLQAKERAQYFQEQFQPLATQFTNLDALSFSDAMELVEVTQDALEDIWKQSEHEPPYPETRMAHLLEVISGSFSRYVQRHLSGLDFWSGQFNQIHSSLQEGLVLCDKWGGASEALTTKYWKQFPVHSWKGNPFISETLTHISQRIEEVSDT